MSGYSYLYSKRYNTPRVMESIEYANLCHMGQVRKSLDKEPFITHCLNVGNLLSRAKCSEDTVIAGILHDTIEDTFVNKQILEEKFGKKVAELVNHVTEQDKSKSWIERCREYIEHLKTAPKEALCISAADKIDNMNSMTDSLSRNYNIFQNMKATPEMHLNKFRTIFEIIHNKIPKNLEHMYQISLEKLISAIKNFK